MRAFLRRRARLVCRASRGRGPCRRRLAKTRPRTRRSDRGQAAGRHCVGHRISRGDLGRWRGRRRQSATRRDRVGGDSLGCAFPLGARRVARRYARDMAREDSDPRRMVPCAVEGRGCRTASARRGSARLLGPFVGDVGQAEGRRPSAAVRAALSARRRRNPERRTRGSPVRDVEAVLRVSAGEQPVLGARARCDRHPRSRTGPRPRR